MRGTRLPKLVHLVHCELLGAQEGVELVSTERQVVCGVGIPVRIDHFPNVSQRLVLDTICWLTEG